MWYRLGALSCIVAAGLVGGCAKEPPPTIVQAEGTVLLDGKPLHKVEVRFIPVNEVVGAEYIAKGVTDDQGRFKLMCNGQPGACAGESYVVVREAEIPQNLQGEKSQKELANYIKKLGNRPIPTKYSNVA